MGAQERAIVSEIQRYGIETMSIVSCFIVLVVAQSKHVDEIPRAHTPRVGSVWPFQKCGYGKDPEDMPEPILGNCSDPISVGIPDFRGLWQDDRHIERIEQCGDRIVLT